MARVETPVTRAYWRLANLARQDGNNDTQLFALAWLAAGRMVALQRVEGITAVDELAELQAWEMLVEAGFPGDAYDLIAGHRFSKVAQDVSRRASAAAIVSELEKELGQHRWDVLPCLAEIGRRDAPDGTIVPELASLLMDMIEAPANSEVWIPFDFQGQLTIEALRRGWRVMASSPLVSMQLVRQLLLTIETGHPQPPSVRAEIERDAAGRPVGRADYALVIPPFGMPVKDSRLTMWDITGTRAYEQFARSESWALFEFANRVDKRVVFLTLQGTLFAKGQEQRLREYLMSRTGACTKLQSVIGLPAGVLSAIGIPPAIMVLSGESGSDSVYMADLGNGRRAMSDAGDIVASGRELALGQAEPHKARLVSPEEIEANELSLVPSRYLRRVADLGDTVRLGDICVAIRPPVVSKEKTPFEVAEVGLPDLNKWQAINDDIEKTIYLKSAPKGSMELQPGDVVVSIKGVGGRVALMGRAADSRPTVVSQSCLVLRLNPGENFSPEALVMYLRSPHGQAQFAALQVGGSVQHISPGTLMGSYVIPCLSIETHQEVRQEYARLCELESQVANIEAEITEIARRRWSQEFE